MHWKQIILTASITLLVTVISGIAVNWYTQTSIQDDAKEALIYEVKNIAQFDSDSTNISILTLEVFNEGSGIAKNVEIKVKFAEDSEVIDYEGVLQRTNESIQNIGSDENSLSYEIERLYQNDQFFLNVAFKDLSEEPKIIVQSSTSVGREREVNSLEEKTAIISRYAIILIISLSILILSLIYIAVKFVMKFHPASLNNTGFLFLHKGKIDLAIEFLEKAMDKGSTYFELSNLALAKCLNEESKKDYDTLIEIAEFLSGSKNFQLLFTKMLIAAKEKNYDEVEAKFDEAYKRNRSRFKTYFSYSRIPTFLGSKDPDLIKVFDDLKTKYNIKESAPKIYFLS